jgi:hypothetical protein
MLTFYVNSASCRSLAYLKTLFPSMEGDGLADLTSIARTFGDPNLNLIGTVMIREAAADYIAERRGGRRLSRRRVQQMLAPARFFMRCGEIPATVIASLHTHLDLQLATMAAGKVARIAPWRVCGSP